MPARSTSAVDELLDALHVLGACGCAGCPHKPCLQTGQVPGGQVWLGALLPGGVWQECWGASLDVAAQRLTRAIEPPVGC